MELLAIQQYLQAHAAKILAETVRLARHESPSHDIPALRALADTLTERLATLGATVESHDDPAGRRHVVGRFPGPPGVQPALVLGHFDTVWPLGTLERMPLVQEGSSLRGPGVYDMKANLAVFLGVVEALQALGAQTPRPVTVLFTADEEIGSPGSRTLIERLASEAGYVLVPEPPLANGGLKTARKGVGRFTIEVEGKAAHAGVAPEQGVSAIVELARQVLRLQALNAPEQGTTVNIGVIQGGTTTNVVPARARADVDVRATSRSAAEALEQAILAATPFTPGARVRVEGGFNRPPMERTPAIVELFRQASSIARELGISLTEGATGGGSDGNFTAALGVPTLDGLGVLGGGAHAESEHIVIASIPDRAALLAALLLQLEDAAL